MLEVREGRQPTPILTFENSWRRASFRYSMSVPTYCIGFCFNSPSEPCSVLPSLCSCHTAPPTGHWFSRVAGGRSGPRARVGPASFRFGPSWIWQTPPLHQDHLTLFRSPFLASQASTGLDATTTWPARGEMGKKPTMSCTANWSSPRLNLKFARPWMSLIRALRQVNLHLEIQIQQLPGAQPHEACQPRWVAGPRSQIACLVFEVIHSFIHLSRRSLSHDHHRTLPSEEPSKKRKAALQRAPPS